MKKINLMKEIIKENDAFNMNSILTNWNFYINNLWKIFFESG